MVSTIDKYYTVVFIIIYTSDFRVSSTALKDGTTSNN